MAVVMYAVLATSCARPVFNSSADRTYPSKPADCRFRTTASHPGPGYVEIGIVSIEGDTSFGAGMYRNAEEFTSKVRKEVCAAGGDVVATEVSSYGVIVRGVVFRKVDASPANACVPPCSPGFRCQGGMCRAVCNPPCTAGQTCGQDRTCHAN